MHAGLPVNGAYFLEFVGSWLGAGSFRECLQSQRIALRKPCEPLSHGCACEDRLGSVMKRFQNPQHLEVKLLQ